MQVILLSAKRIVMSKLNLIMIVVISYVFLTGCSHIRDERYLVSFYQMDQVSKTDQIQVDCLKQTQDW